MIVLAIETSTARSSVALLVDGEVSAREHHDNARGHGAFLAPALRRCLDAEAVGGDVARVDAVAVGTGPGLYTGLRVGIATASAFASARAIPIVGIGGMEALAYASGSHDAHLVTTLDARRGQVFWAVHAPGPGGMGCVAAPRVGTREALDDVVAALATHGPVGVVGEVGGEHVVRPDAVATAQLAHARLVAMAADGSIPAPVIPIYLRDADVRIGWDERGGVRVGAPSDGQGSA